MIESSLATAAEAMRGQLFGADLEFRGASTDTRSIAKGELFFALTGPNFDGATFVSQAERAGAAGVVASRDLDTGLPLIVVEDTRIALGDLARTWRESMPARVVGITGSNGKTTLKEMISSCLSLAAHTLATKGNLNNEVGVPLMLFELSREHRYAVIEMGANHAGEIAYLTGLVQPYVAAITNAGPAHLEGFGSVEGVAQAKGEILEGRARPRYAVLNRDDPYFEYWASKARDLRVISFGIAQNADVRAHSIESIDRGSRFTLATPSTELQIELKLPGSHNVLNACAAAAIAHALELPAENISRGLHSSRPVAGRLRPILLRHGIRIYDDSYNANPDSVEAAAEFLASQPGTSLLVLGDMGELGERAASLHREVGEVVKQAGVDRLYACGALSRDAVAAFGAGARWFESVDLLIEALRGELQENCSILVKGSRAMHMERVVEALSADRSVN